MQQKYWLDLFTGKTWEQFLKNGATISGFRESKKKTVLQLKTGDYLLCYVTGISRFIGVLEVTGEPFTDNTPLWNEDVFPCRVPVKVLYKLTPETAVPVYQLKDKLTFFQNMKSPIAWTGHFRGSPTAFSFQDGEAIVNAIQQAHLNPVKQEYDEKKYLKETPSTYESKIGQVTVPDDNNTHTEKDEKFSNRSIPDSTHEEIQYLLLKLGSNLGLDVWVATNDKNKQYNGQAFSQIPRFRNDLPLQFDTVTNKTIERIDVLWLQGDAFIAAFEVEHTTSIYSGLLRMSDLVSMQPNIKLNLYIVAPDDRRGKVFEEINRPTFAKLKLPKICKFISYSELKTKYTQIQPFVQYLKPDFIEEVAETCEPID